MMKIVPGNYCDDMDPIVAAREARRIQQLLTGSEDNTAEPMAGTTDYLKFVRQLTEKFSLFDQLKSIPLSLSKEPANLSRHAISEHATINPVKLPNINEFLVNEKMHPGVYTEWIQAVCNLLENEMNE
uniref:Uncharacterized protein n=1 Tax=Caenorhabditis japonica TaxID=281687 RepID=A0A8R1J0V2_CAEJA